MKITNGQKRFREYGLTAGKLPVGKRNLISDVAGVSVGHTSLVYDSDIRTGVTVINPGVPDMFHTKIPAAIAVGNGFGKMTGVTQVHELGTLETPIALTNTLAVGRVMRGVVDIVLTESVVDPATTINAVVGETNDGFLNAIHKNVITEMHVRQAFRACRADFALGAVGAGTGTRSFSWKGGIGSSSRVIAVENEAYVMGVLVQTNYGGDLRISGVPVEQVLASSGSGAEAGVPDGSCMIVVATDAPCSARQLQRIATRSFFGLALTGSVMAHGSGDYAIAFTTNKSGALPDEMLTVLFQACIEAVEESVYDALFAAHTMTGRNGHVLHALPVPRVVQLLQQHAL